MLQNFLVIDGVPYEKTAIFFTGSCCLFSFWLTPGFPWVGIYLRIDVHMYFRIAADGVLLLHLSFILFAIFGGALAARWRWIPLVHLPVAAWAFFVEMTGRICPLTYLENDLRVRAGESGYAESFVEHYLLGVIYPAGLNREGQFVLAATVVVVNIAIYVWSASHRRAQQRRAQARTM